MPNRSKAPQTQQPREIVRTMAAYGIPAEQIAMCMEMSAPTLRKHFRKELDTAKIQANAQVAGFLFANAKKGNVTAQILWLKTQAGWKEPVQVQHSGAVGIYDFSKIPTDELRTVISILSAAGVLKAELARREAAEELERVNRSADAIRARCRTLAGGLQLSSNQPRVSRHGYHRGTKGSPANASLTIQFRCRTGQACQVARRG